MTRESWKSLVMLAIAVAAVGCTVSRDGLNVAVDDDVPQTGGAGEGGMAAGGAAGNEATLDAGLTDAPALPCPGATGFGKSPGQTCACAAECASNFCVDGVCCEEACTGACRTCAGPNAAGQCRFASAEQADPRGQCATQAPVSCGTTGRCDGEGGCSKHPAGTTCGEAESCMNSLYKGKGRCDGTGVCTPAATVDCSPFVCGVSACLSSCEDRNDCAPGLTCVNGKCEGRRNLGASCTMGSECLSNFCADGVCCNEACSGECRSCALSESRGQCRLVPAGSPADPGECAAQPASSCGRSGACNGQGACALYVAGTVCAAASCSNNVQSEVSACNGMGSCVQGNTKPCAPYVCGGAAMCLERCSSDAACSGGAICVYGACGTHPVLDLPFRLSPPEIDGSIDSVWELASALQPIQNYVFGTAVNSFGAQWRGFWSPQGLHLLILVDDNKRYNDSAGQGSFDDDTVEVYIDADGNRGTTLDGQNDHHFLFGWNDTEPQNVSLRRIEGVGFAQSQRGPGYLMELSFPWTTLGTTAAAGKIFGIDVHVNDDDDGGPRERKIAWFATQDLSFRDPSSYGRVRLLP